jgi:hypothetical protein
LALSPISREIASTGRAGPKLVAGVGDVR